MLRRTISIAVVLVARMASGQQPDASTLPPADIFDMDAMRDVGTLDLKTTADEAIAVEARANRKVRKVAFEFFSHDWQGEAQRHGAVVYVPADGVAPEKRGMAVVNQGSSGNVEAGFDIERDYGAITALDLGVVSVLLEFNIQHSGVRQPGPLRRHTTAKFFETGDPHWIHWVALAKVYMRGMTAVNEIEGIDAERFVIGGCSKRAQAAWIVAATDERIAGIVAMARPGNFTHQIQGRAQGRLATPDDPRMIGGENRERMVYVEDMYTKRGYEYMAYIDPYYFLSRVHVPVMSLIGTNDNIFESFDDHGFYPFYRGDKCFGYVVNYSHGMASQKHVQAFQAWTAHCFWGRPVTRLTSLGEREGDSFAVRAIVRPESDKAKLTEVNLHYCTLKGNVFNDRVDRYVSVPLERVGATTLWQASVDIPDTTIYWYVEAIDEAMGFQGFSTTLLEQTPPKTKP